MLVTKFLKMDIELEEDYYNGGCNINDADDVKFNKIEELDVNNLTKEDTYTLLTTLLKKYEKDDSNKDLSNILGSYGYYRKNECETNDFYYMKNKTKRSELRLIDPELLCSSELNDIINDEYELYTGIDKDVFIEKLYPDIKERNKILKEAKKDKEKKLKAIKDKEEKALSLEKVKQQKKIDKMKKDLEKMGVVVKIET